MLFLRDAVLFRDPSPTIYTMKERDDWTAGIRERDVATLAAVIHHFLSGLLRAATAAGLAADRAEDAVQSGVLVFVSRGRTLMAAHKHRRGCRGSSRERFRNSAARFATTDVCQTERRRFQICRAGRTIDRRSSTCDPQRHAAVMKDTKPSTVQTKRGSDCSPKFHRHVNPVPL